MDLLDRVENRMIDVTELNILIEEYIDTLPSGKDEWYGPEDEVASDFMEEFTNWLDNKQHPFKPGDLVYAWFEGGREYKRVGFFQRSRCNGNQHVVSRIINGEMPDTYDCIEKVQLQVK